MHAYFIDDWTGQRKYLRAVDGLDLRLTQNGLSGRKIKLHRLHDLDASVRDLAENGIRIFVAVGNDNTASRLINSLLKLEESAGPKKRKFIFGILPIGDNQKIAASLNCRSLESAVLALKNRRTVVIDLGLLNRRHYFVTAATFRGRVSVGFLSYTVSSLRPDHEVSLCNANIFSNIDKFHQPHIFDLRDGTLEAVIARPTAKKNFWSNILAQSDVTNNYIIESVFPFQKITMQSPAKTIKVWADAEKEFSTPVSVEVMPARLEVVVGAATGA